MNQTRSDLNGWEQAQHRGPMGAREIAGTLLLLIKLGLARRELGMCLGTGLHRRISTASTGTTIKGVWSRFWAKRHARNGHDKGCYAFGISLDEVSRVLRRVDQVGISPLLIEAIECAALELNASPAPWSGEYALETVQIQIRRRINPI